MSVPVHRFSRCSWCSQLEHACFCMRLSEVRSTFAVLEGSKVNGLGAPSRARRRWRQVMESVGRCCAARHFPAVPSACSWSCSQSLREATCCPERHRVPWSKASWRPSCWSVPASWDAWYRTRAPRMQRFRHVEARYPSLVVKDGRLSNESLQRTGTAAVSAFDRCRAALGFVAGAASPAAELQR